MVKSDTANFTNGYPRNDIVVKGIIRKVVSVLCVRNIRQIRVEND